MTTNTVTPTTTIERDARLIHARDETANPGEHLRTLRAFDDGLDAIDQGIAGVDIDTGIAVSQRSGLRHVGLRETGRVVRGCGILHECTAFPYARP